MDVSEPELVAVCEELGLSVRQAKRKKPIMELLQESEVIREREAKHEREESEKRAYELELESARRAHELEPERVEIERAKFEVESSSRPGSGVLPAERVKILIQPYRLGEDIGLFLINFERTCKRAGFEREEWPQKLLTLLPCEAADVIARLTSEEAESYDSSKAALLKKYRLSKEAFRQRLRTATRKATDSFPDFAYALKGTLK